MVEKALDTFIKTILNYFDSTYNIGVDIGTPYLVNDLSDLKGDYSGVIDISGRFSGHCYFSTPTSLLKRVLEKLNIKSAEIESDMVLQDIAGEIANTLSGNARAELGEDFIISIPKVYRGKNILEAFSEDKRTYAIPIKLETEKAYLGVTLS